MSLKIGSKLSPTVPHSPVQSPQKYGLFVWVRRDRSEVSQPIERGDARYPQAHSAQVRDGQTGPRAHSTYLPDGGSPYLRIARAGSKSWVFRYRERGGKRTLRELGLGGFPGVSLAEARIKADSLRKQLGIKPTLWRIAVRRRLGAVACPHLQSGQPNISNGENRFRQPRGARRGLPDRP